MQGSGNFEKLQEPSPDSGLQIRQIITTTTTTTTATTVHYKWVCTRWQWYYNTQNSTHTHTFKTIHYTQNYKHNKVHVLHTFKTQNGNFNLTKNLSRRISINKNLA